MKNIFFLLILFTLLSCNGADVQMHKARDRYWSDQSNVHEIYKGVDYKIVEMDSCEYIIGKDKGPYNGGYFLSHRGRCKYCKLRK